MDATAMFQAYGFMIRSIQCMEQAILEWEMDRKYTRFLNDMENVRLKVAKLASRIDGAIGFEIIDHACPQPKVYKKIKAEYVKLLEEFSKMAQIDPACVAKIVKDLI